MRRKIALGFLAFVAAFLAWSLRFSPFPYIRVPRVIAQAAFQQDCPSGTSIISPGSWRVMNQSSQQFIQFGCVDHDGDLIINNQAFVPSGGSIMSAYRHLPATGGRIHVYGSQTIPLGTLVFTNAIHLDCDDRTTTELTFTGTSGIAISLAWENPGGGGSGDYFDMGNGVFNCTLIGPGGLNGGAGNAGTGVSIGVTGNATLGAVLSNDYISGFTTGLTWATVGSWGTRVVNSTFANSTKDVSYTLSGAENIVFDHDIFTNFATGEQSCAVNLAATSFSDTTFIADSFDSDQLCVAGNAKNIVTDISGHYENAGGNTTSPFVSVTNGSYSAFGTRYFSDNSSGTIPEFVEFSGGQSVEIFAPYFDANTVAMSQAVDCNTSAKCVVDIANVKGTFTNGPVNTNANETYWRADDLGNFLIGGSLYLQSSNKALNISGHLDQTNANRFAGSCAMVTATTCTATIAAGYTSAPVCVANDNTAFIAAHCAVSGTTVTVTAASSNSDTFYYFLVGNPN